MRYSPTVKVKKEKDQKVDANSIWKQRSAIERWATERGTTITHWFQDEETSGRIPLFERPGGMEMLNLIKTGIKDVVVYKIDRIFRDTKDGLETLDDWKVKGVMLHCTDGVSLDVNTAVGRLITTVLLGFCEFEPRQTAERTSDGMLDLQKRGKKVSSCPPYGKRLDGNQTIDDPAEQSAIAVILKWRQDYPDLGPRTMARYADEVGLPCRGKKWHHETIKRIVKAHGQSQ